MKQKSTMINVCDSKNKKNARKKTSYDEDFYEKKTNSKPSKK